MITLYIILAVLFFVAVNILIGSFVGYKMSFYVNRKEKSNKITTKMTSDDFVPYYGLIDDCKEKILVLPSEKVSIISHDNLKLVATYYEYSKDAPIEILVHGYRSNSHRDMAIYILRALKLKHSALVIDQRASGYSEGKVTTFGIKERYDVLDWANYLAKRFPENKIILSGISMGTATVLMATGLDLPKNVWYVVADCGFSCIKSIITNVMDKMGLPSKILFPMVQIGAKLYGKFNVLETSPIEEIKKSKVPVIFFHGTKDNFVPYQMSVDNYNACPTKKKLVSFEGVSHALCYYAQTEKYFNELVEFEKSL